MTNFPKTVSSLPSREEAERLWQDGIDYRCRYYGFLDYGGNEIKDEYIFHTRSVAQTASKIAAAVNLNSEKAYILGLLHDCGRRVDEFRGGRFHAVEGFDMMMKLGYAEVARICISHSFPQPDFDIKNYPKFSKADLLYAKKILNNMVYDDYDYLIQFCDLLFEGLNMVGINTRVRGIMRRYGLPFQNVSALWENGRRLKKYFDDKLGKDIYDFLGIKDEDTFA